MFADGVLRVVDLERCHVVAGTAERRHALAAARFPGSQKGIGQGQILHQQRSQQTAQQCAFLQRSEARVGRHRALVCHATGNGRLCMCALGGRQRKAGKLLITESYTVKPACAFIRLGP